MHTEVLDRTPCTAAPAIVVTGGGLTSDDARALAALDAFVAVDAREFDTPAWWDALYALRDVARERLSTNGL